MGSAIPPPSGGAGNWMMVDRGVWKDARTKHVVLTIEDGTTGGVRWTGYINYWNPVYSYRSIFCGWNVGENGERHNPPAPNAIRWDANPKPGVYPTMNPVGLGFLASSGYVADVAIFFCPSSENMPSDSMIDTLDYCNAATQLGELKRAGGTRPEDVMRGDYGWLKAWDERAGSADYCLTKVILGHYNYRLKPTENWPDDGLWGRYRFAPDVRYYAYFAPAYVQPRQTVLAGEPVFKTQKQLGSRAIVSDSFSKNLSYYRWPELEPGYGIYGHRDGYNVLYGDWSAKWYGDPQQQIIWWPKTSYGVMASEWGMCQNSVADYWLPTGSDPNYWPNSGHWLLGTRWGSVGGQAVFHLFDKANGVDTNESKAY